MCPGSSGWPTPVDATTTTSGTSHRSIAPSPLSSVRFATSGVTMLLVSPFGPIHIHWMSGSKLFAGATSVQFGTPFESSVTLQRLTGSASTDPLPPSPPLPSRCGDPHAVTAINTNAVLMPALYARIATAVVQYLLRAKLCRQELPHRGDARYVTQRAVTDEPQIIARPVVRQGWREVDGDQVPRLEVRHRGQHEAEPRADRAELRGEVARAQRDRRGRDVLRAPARRAEAREVAVPLRPRRRAPVADRAELRRDPRRRGRDPRRGAELRGHEVGALRANGAQREIGLVARQVARRDHGIELDRDPRILLAKARQRGRDERAREARRGRDPDHAFGEVLDVARVAREPGERGLHRLGRRAPALGRSRRLKALAGPFEQALAEILFERGEAAPHRRGIEAEPARRGRERAPAVDREGAPEGKPPPVK